MNEVKAVAPPVRYRAFISYSHADSRFAAWLHRRLETWAVPGQGRLSPIFIDRAELAAGPDLSASVREALAGSAALIVIASPAARASQWVSQEIALFRALHPARPVLAALVTGEPGDAFPEALLRHDGAALEPLAADFRHGRDGRQLALLKIVAGLTGQPLDRLVQRDAQSRQRRVMAITAGALLLSLILAAMLVVALRARAEADRQRAEAEGMVEFMLTDLRERLKGTGSPTIMAAVNERALKYYSQQDLATLPDASLDRRARVLHAMGEDDEHLGRFPAALEKYKEAWRITGAVLSRHPRNPEAIFAHAQSEYWVGEAAWQQGDLATTEMHWRGYLAQAEALERSEPGRSRAQMELGFAHGNICELTARKDADPGKALPDCTAASTFFRRAEAASPGDARIALALANRLGWQADLELRAMHADVAIALRSEEAAILDRLLRSDPGNSTYQERRLWPEVGKAKALLAIHQPAAAIALLRQVLVGYEQLAKRRPDDTLITEQRMRVTWMLATSSRDLGLPEAAAWTARTATLHRELGRTHTPGQMARFDKMITALNEGDKK